MFLLDVMPEERQNITVIKLLFTCAGIRRGLPGWYPWWTGEWPGEPWYPAWRRICKTLIKNDFWCRTLSLVRTNPGTMNVIYCEWKKGGGMGDSVTAEILGNMIRQYFIRHELKMKKGPYKLWIICARASWGKSFCTGASGLCVVGERDDVVANDYNPNVMAPGEKKRWSSHWKKMASHNHWWCQKRESLSGGGWFSPTVIEQGGG